MLLSQLRTLQSRKRRLLSLVQDGVLEPDDFKREHNLIKAEIVNVEAAISEVSCQSQELNCETAPSYLEHLLHNQHLYWNQSDAAGKRRQAKRIFPSDIRCANEGYRIPSTCSFFSMFGDESVGRNELVALPGIEPGF